MKKVSKGSPEQLIDMMSRKIDQLSGNAVDSCSQPVMSEDDIAENPAYEEIDDSSREEYINNLIDSVKANIDGSGYSVSAENIPDEQRIVVTVSDMSSIVREYSIPYGDLNFEDIDADTEYCTNEILYDIDENNPDGTPREDAEEDPEDEFGHW